MEFIPMKIEVGMTILEPELLGEPPIENKKIVKR
jgi:hypothetical protein